MITQREIGFALGGFGVGVVVGYFSVKKQMELRYAEISRSEADTIRAHYHAKEVADAGTQAKAEILSGIVNHLEYDVPDEEEAQIESQNAFELDPPKELENVDWDYSVEEAWRNAHPDHPYIIHFDEFMAPGNPNTHVCYTYYSVDNVLVDENEQPINGEKNIDRLIGLDNLQRLGSGHGTGDENTLLIRNDTLQMDIEVTNHPYSWEQEHLGEIEHANDYNKRHRRPKFDDE